jgi:membrane protein DedA with SNARE-associated domain
LTELIQQFGPLAVFALMVPESACIPIPSEVTLLFSGFAVSQHLMSFCLAVVAATAGNVLGSLIAYGVGGTELVRRIPVAGRLLARHERSLGEHALRAVFVARLLPLARTFVSLPAGARRVPLGPFVALTAAGCGLWAAGFVLLGDVSGVAWSAVSSLVAKASVALVVAVVVLWVARRLRNRS